MKYAVLTDGGSSLRIVGAPPDARDGADALAAAFGLTPAETKVLAILFGGRTLADTAAALGITKPTAKTHLEHTPGRARLS
jgi:DNA-binding CsgD family transcriptional regulator